jgi:hypothetical protein
VCVCVCGSSRTLVIKCVDVCQSTCVCARVSVTAILVYVPVCV